MFHTEFILTPRIGPMFALRFSMIRTNDAEHAPIAKIRRKAPEEPTRPKRSGETPRSKRNAADAADLAPFPPVRQSTVI